MVRMLYRFAALVAAIGFVASVGCHLMGWLQIEPAGGQWVFILHVGILMLWVPLVTMANRTMPKPGRGNVEHLMAELPKWARNAVSVLFVYALLNFAYFIYCTSQYPKHKVPFSLELRGFSGHWMMFYSAAWTGFVGLSRLARKRGASLGGDDRATYRF